MQREHLASALTPPKQACHRPVWRGCADGWQRSTVDVLVEETPVAMVYNGISHAVMLATPSSVLLNLFFNGYQPDLRHQPRPLLVGPVRPPAQPQPGRPDRRGLRQPRTDKTSVFTDPQAYPEHAGSLLELEPHR